MARLSFFLLPAGLVFLMMGLIGRPYLVMIGIFLMGLPLMFGMERPHQEEPEVTVDWSYESDDQRLRDADVPGRRVRGPEPR